MPYTIRENVYRTYQDAPYEERFSWAIEVVNQAIEEFSDQAQRALNDIAEYGDESQKKLVEIDELRSDEEVDFDNPTLDEAVSLLKKIYEVVDR